VPPPRSALARADIEEADSGLMLIPVP